MSHTRLEEMLTESGLPTDDVADLATLLAPLDVLTEEVPAPSAELAALFGPPAEAPVSLSDRRRRAVAGALVLALSGVGATGLSAAANTLPRPIQERVSEFSHHYLPFDLPAPPPPGDPLGAEQPSPTWAQPRPGDADSSRSAQQRAGIPGFAPAPAPAHDAAGHPTRSYAYAVAPSAAPSPSGPAQPTPSSAPSEAPTPSGGPVWGGSGTGGHGGHEGRPTKTGTKGPGKGGGEDGPDGTGDSGSGAGPDAKPGGGQDAGPIGADPVPTLPDPPDPVIPEPTIPLPDPLPDITPVLPTPDNSPLTTGD